MIECRTAAELQAAVAASPEHRALVPTMGDLHAGHLSLIDQARGLESAVWVSVFVNRFQFNEPSDYAVYRQQTEADFEQLRTAGVDLVYAPDERSMWGLSAPDLESFEVPGLTDVLEGKYRPGHLCAVAAVVDQLFMQTQPTSAVFGEKDYQQLVLVRDLAARRSPAIRIAAGSVVREADGLAMSSRNQRLSPEARQQAVQLPQVLTAAARSLERGVGIEAVEREAYAALQTGGFEMDYVAVRSADDLSPVAQPGRWVVLAAGRLGGVRLLDVCPAVGVN